jgi:hypothetical protein
LSQIQNVLRVLPDMAGERKTVPILTGAVDYFPLALAEVAKISYEGNKQHNPGEPLHWARHKSSDHGDCVLRHLIERGTLDTDGQRHTAKAAWRILALLQEELEQAAGWTPAAKQSVLDVVREKKIAADREIARELAELQSEVLYGPLPLRATQAQLDEIAAGNIPGLMRPTLPVASGK